MTFVIVYLLITFCFWVWLVKVKWATTTSHLSWITQTALCLLAAFCWPLFLLSFVSNEIT